MNTEEFARYLERCNDQRNATIANHKLMAKDILAQANIPHPHTIDSIKARDESDIVEYPWEELPETFVIKGALGSEGESVLIINDREKDSFILPNNEKIKRAEIVEHARRIYNGEYSNIVQTVYDNEGKHLHDTAWKDVVMIEELLATCNEMKNYITCGIADVRIMMYKLVPVHARLRLPTKKSLGRSNVALGTPAPLVTIDGKTTRAGLDVDKCAPLKSETGKEIIDIQVPFWNQCLQYAAETEHAFRLNTCTVDIALTDNGPKVLELHGQTGRWHGGTRIEPIQERIKLVDENIHEIKDIKTALELAKKIREDE